MKKRLTAVLLTFALLMLSGCSAAQTVRKLEAAEEKLEDSLRSDDPTRPLPAATENPRLLTEAQARQIALDHLGFTEDQVTKLRSEYETDDGVPLFEVEFHREDWEYSFEIHAESGRILSYDKDYRYD